jgi:NADH:ubiquinone oxidoreductase subunit K
VIYLVIYWAIEYFGDTTFTQFQRELENGPAEAKIILPIILLLPFISLVLPLFIKKLRTTKNLAQYFFAFEIPFVAVVLNLIFPYIAGYSDSDSPYILTVLIISIRVTCNIRKYKI